MESLIDSAQIILDAAYTGTGIRATLKSKRDYVRSLRDALVKSSAESMRYNLAQNEMNEEDLKRLHCSMIDILTASEKGYEFARVSKDSARVVRKDSKLLGTYVSKYLSSVLEDRVSSTAVISSVISNWLPTEDFVVDEAKIQKQFSEWLNESKGSAKFITEDLLAVFAEAYPKSQITKSGASKDVANPKVEKKPEQKDKKTESSDITLKPMDWKLWVGKDLLFTYTQDWKMESFGGQKHEFSEKQTTKMRVREVNGNTARILFWETASATEPIFSGWINTEVSTSLPIFDIESEPIYILGTQFRGKQYSNMRTERLRGGWATKFIPANITNANDVIPYYGLQFGEQRKDKQTFTVTIDRPATAFPGGNTFGTITILPERQTDSSWIISAGLDVSKAQDDRLGGGKVRIRYGNDGILTSFEDSFKGEMQVKGIKGEGTVKWSVKRILPQKK